MTADANGRHFTVLGAGIVGVCCALHLQRDGHRVTLIDRDEPGRGATFGNAGLIQVESVVPIATPGILWKVPGMLADPLGPLAIKWRYLPRLAPYLTGFLAASRPRRFEDASEALAAILGHAVEGYAPLLRHAQAEHLVTRSGELTVFKSEANWRAHAPIMALRRRRGIPVEELSGEEIRAREPALSRDIVRGFLLPEVRKTANPYTLARRLAESFLQGGGEIVRAEIRDVEIGADGPAALATNAGRRHVDGLVIALGAYSKRLAARLGVRVPLDTERGYHMMLPAPEVALSTPVLSGDHRFAITPMEDGLRLAGTAELASLDAPPDWRRADILVTLAKRLLPGLDAAGGERWMGRRPSTPDSLPVIGRSPRWRNAWLAFGHGHLGLTMAGITGRLIADLAAGRTPPLDISPFRPGRFRPGG